jgi:N-methylhydantoinase A/oxoprolinase/acetone carboxylase beta subunit
MIRLGVDTGGTFTDFVLWHEGRLTLHKVRSTPDDPSRAVLEGLRDLLATADPAEMVHGSTVATNAVLERRGARVAMLATRGFADVLRIGRQTRPALYDFFVEAPQPLVSPSLTVAVDERIAADGAVLLAPDEAGLRDLVEQLRAAAPESVAVCFLHSYANPSHETLVAARVRRELAIPVSASSEVLPEYREFERWSTTALNAYVAPIMSRYLERVEESIAQRRLRIMQSNGGALSASQARATPARTVLSGPAGGAVGAQAIAAASGFPRVIGFDMGGTSTDVTLIDGEIGVTPEAVVAGLPVRLPMIDIHTVGAGGGSLAWVDTGGALRVGPRSAGADPGPACYGTGEGLTVTDANLILGRLDAGTPLAGRLRLDAGRAKRLAEAFGAPLGLGAVALAAGIVRIANATMERAIRVVSIERGIDPRGFALLAFGGAGGMHACALAEALDMRTVVVPRYAGVLSALGMLVADTVRDFSQTVLLPADAAPDAIEARFAPLVSQARADLSREGFAAGEIRVDRSLDVRYVGQAYELTVPWGSDLRGVFDAAHQQRYGYADVKRPAEIVNVRVRASGPSPRIEWPREAASEVPAAPCSRRPVWFGGVFVETGVFDQATLHAGASASGPAIVAGPEATAVIPPAWRFRVDEVGSLVLTRE